MSLLFAKQYVEKKGKKNLRRSKMWKQASMWTPPWTAIASTHKKSKDTALRPVLARPATCQFQYPFFAWCPYHIKKNKGALFFHSNSVSWWQQLSIHYFRTWIKTLKMKIMNILLENKRSKLQAKSKEIVNPETMFILMLLSYWLVTFSNNFVSANENAWFYCLHCRSLF